MSKILKNKSLWQIEQIKWSLLFAFSSLFVLGLADNIRGPLFPEILNYFNLSSSMGSLSFATTSTAAFLASFFSALYLKKRTLSSLHQLSMLVMSVGLLLMGISKDFNFFLGGSFVLGLSIGFMGVSQNLLVSESVPPEKQSKALSGLHAMYGFASFLAPLLAAKTTENYSSWRAAFIVVSIFCLLFFIFQILTKPEPEFIVHSLPQKNKDDDSRVSKISLFTIAGLFGFYVVAEILVSTRLAQYMRTYFQMNLESSSGYVTLFFMFLLLGRLLFAIKKMPLSLKWQMNLSLVGSFILLTLGLKIHPFFLALVGFAMAPFYPLSVAYISEKAGTQARTFITFAMGFQSFAVITMHLGVGYLTDKLGLFYAFGVGLFAIVLSLLCLNLHPPILKSK